MASAATTALVVATPAAVDRCSTGHGDPPILPVSTKNDAPRGQKTVTSAGGKRLEALLEVAGPQEAAVTVGHVAASAPLLVVLSLRVADSVDGTTVSYLLKVALNEEEEA